MFKNVYGPFSVKEILDGFKKNAVVGFARMVWDAFYGLVWITHPGEWIKRKEA